MCGMKARRNAGRSCPCGPYTCDYRHCEKLCKRAQTIKYPSLNQIDAVSRVFRYFKSPSIKDGSEWNNSVGRDCEPGGKSPARSMDFLGGWAYPSSHCVDANQSGSSHSPSNRRPIPSSNRLQSHAPGSANPPVGDPALPRRQVHPRSTSAGYHHR